MADDMLDMEDEEIYEPSMSRSVQLSLRVGVKFQTIDSQLVDIDRRNGEVTFLSPMSGPRPRPVKIGTTIKVKAETLGAPATESEIIAVEQYLDEKDETWYVKAEQDGIDWDDWELKRRGFVREMVNFQIGFGNPDDEEPTFKGYLENISGSGIRFNSEFETRDTPFKIGDPILLFIHTPDIKDPDENVVMDGAELPPIPAKVVRMYEATGLTRRNVWIMGIHYDEFSEEDQDIEDYLIRYVLKLQIVNQAMNQ